MKQALFVKKEKDTFIDTISKPAINNTNHTFQTSEMSQTFQLKQSLLGDLGDVIPLAKKDSVILAENVIKKDAVFYDIGDWKQFFIQYQKKTNIDMSCIVKRNELLYKRNLELKQKLDFMQTQIEVMRSKDLEKEERLLKKKNAIPQTIRDSITEKEFKETLQIVKQNHFVASRKKAALLLLYVTGLRVSSLLKIKIKHIEEFLKKGETFLDLINKGKEKHLLMLSDKSRELLKQFADLFYILMKDKNQEQFLFTTIVKFDKPINRSSFDSELNQVLTKASHKFNKHIRTHSFRASLISDFLKSTLVDIVKEIVGHKDIKTTLQYKKENFDNSQIKKIYQNLDIERSLNHSIPQDKSNHR